MQTSEVTLYLGPLQLAARVEQAARAILKEAGIEPFDVAARAKITSDAVTAVAVVVHAGGQCQSQRNDWYDFPQMSVSVLVADADTILGILTTQVARTLRDAGKLPEGKTEMRIMTQGTEYGLRFTLRPDDEPHIALPKELAN